MPHSNHLGQPIGFAVPNWAVPPVPPREPMPGRFCRLEPLEPIAHAKSLHAANCLDTEGRMWTYLGYGPFDLLETYRAWAADAARSSSELFFAIISSQASAPVGAACYQRIDPPNGVIEVAHVAFSPRLQRTTAATEAMYLMMARAFDLGYRRYEWKCDALNAPSRAAAQRLGLSFEGIFRQAVIYKGRSRDTAWYAATDQDWPQLRAAFTQWLDPANFDATGQQRTSLSSLTLPLLKQRG
jgi:RimJ/RimL family protein N-acetyltransferase